MSLGQCAAVQHNQALALPSSALAHLQCVQNCLLHTHTSICGYDFYFSLAMLTRYSIHHLPICFRRKKKRQIDRSSEASKGS